MLEWLVADVVDHDKQPYAFTVASYKTHRARHE